MECFIPRLSCTACANFINDEQINLLRDGISKYIREKFPTSDCIDIFSQSFLKEDLFSAIQIVHPVVATDVLDADIVNTIYSKCIAHECNQNANIAAKILHNHGISVAICTGYILYESLIGGNKISQHAWNRITINGHKYEIDFTADVHFHTFRQNDELIGRRCAIIYGTIDVKSLCDTTRKNN
jgi:hypothetical protein